MAAESTGTESFWLRVIYIASGVMAVAVAFLIFGPRPEMIEGAPDVSRLPAVNAIINSITSVLLVTAYILIRKKKIVYHRRVMLTAFGMSALFLITYVIYHWFTIGPTPYTGDWRGLYLFILFSHIPLAAAILPLAMVTLYRGWNMQVQKHRKIAKITLPVWLYVSVTGVVIYMMLYL